jgi:hypothetical protein
MNREVHVRVCERQRGKFPWSTRLCTNYRSAIVNFYRKVRKSENTINW